MLLRISGGRLRKHNSSEITGAGTGSWRGMKIDMKTPIVPPQGFCSHLEPRRVEQHEKLGLKRVKGNGNVDRNVEQQCGEC